MKYPSPELQADTRRNRYKLAEDYSCPLPALSCWLDGIQRVATNVVVVTNNITTINTFVIMGNTLSASGRFWAGGIDELIIGNRAISSNEVSGYLFGVTNYPPRSRYGI